MPIMARPMASRSPASKKGTEPGTTTERNRKRSVAPKLAATYKSRASTVRTAAKALMKMGMMVKRKMMKTRVP